MIEVRRSPNLDRRPARDQRRETPKEGRLDATQRRLSPRTQADAAFRGRSGVVHPIAGIERCRIHSSERTDANWPTTAIVVPTIAKFAAVVVVFVVSPIPITVAL